MTITHYPLNIVINHSYVSLPEGMQYMYSIRLMKIIMIRLMKYNNQPILENGECID